MNLDHDVVGQLDLLARRVHYHLPQQGHVEEGLAPGERAVVMVLASGLSCGGFLRPNIC